MVEATLLIMTYLLVVGLVVSTVAIVLFRKITPKESYLLFFTTLIVASLGLVVHFAANSTLGFLLLELAALVVLVRGIRKHSTR